MFDRLRFRWWTMKINCMCKQCVTLQWSVTPILGAKPCDVAKDTYKMLKRIYKKRLILE